MTINSLKELDKLMLLCKRRRIKAIKIDNIEFAIEESALTSHKQPALTSHKILAPDLSSFDPGNISVNDKIDMPDELTPDQLMFFSAQTHVQDEQ